MYWRDGPWRPVGPERSLTPSARGASRDLPATALGVFCWISLIILPCRITNGTHKLTARLQTVLVEMNGDRLYPEISYSPKRCISKHIIPYWKPKDT